MTAEVNRYASARPRYLYAAFIASLALNLVFVGLFAAAVWHLAQEENEAKEPGLLGFVRELPADRQDVVRAEIAAARNSMKDLRTEVRKSWIDTNAMLSQEPFDKAKFLAALTQLRDMENRYKTAVNGPLADTAEMLTPAERKLLQSWRERRRPWLLKSRADRAKDN